MSAFLRRRFERKKSLNLIDYVIAGANGVPIGQGMGRTRNISGAGILLETHIPLEPGLTLLLTIGLGDEIVEIKGYVVHMEPAEENLFWSGIEFTEIDREGRQILEKYLEAFSRTN